MKLFTSLGLMSGTSMDGVDLAVVQTNGHDTIIRGKNAFVPYPDQLRQRIEQGLAEATAINKREERPGSLAELERDITHMQAEAVQQFLNDENIPAQDVDAIGFHGQTVLHRPQEGVTVQLGNGQQLSDETGIDVVYDMRANDMAHGGQGAPLVPVYHRALAHSLRNGENEHSPVVFVNIGGISNVTYTDSDNTLIAFDCGPGNGLIDQWMQMCAGQNFDEGGATGMRGQIVGKVLEHYLAHPYLDKPLPKSLDRLDFSPLLAGDVSLEDGARTLALITATIIIDASRFFPAVPDTWIVCGGGAQNKLIISDLQRLTRDQGSKIVTADEIGLSSDAMEAEAFAYLAIRSKLGLDLTWPGTTGCKIPVTGGVLCTPV